VPNQLLWPVGDSSCIGKDEYGDISTTPAPSPLLPHTPSFEASDGLPSVHGPLSSASMTRSRCTKPGCKAKPPKTYKCGLCIEHCKADGGCCYRTHIVNSDVTVTPIPSNLSQCTQPLEPKQPPPPPSFAEHNPPYNFETPANDYSTSSESDGPASVQATPARKSSVRQVKTTFLTYLWISERFPVPEQYESDVVAGHFHLDAGYLGYMGLEPPFPRIQFYLAKIGQWTGIPLSHPIPISRLIHQDTVLLRVAGVMTTEGLDKIVHDAQAPKISAHDPLASQMAERHRLLKKEMVLQMIELAEQLETGRVGSCTQSRALSLAHQDSASQIPICSHPASTHSHH
jgi:hypothetical protein